MKIILIRHGKTEGNIKGRYIGKTDEPLCEEGINEIRKNTYPKADFVISSPMLRCRQTAEIIYGKIDYIENDLRECDFGEFENKCFEELKDNPDYLKWMESGGTISFPGGESREVFSKRCVEAFERLIFKYSDLNTIAFVVHGGTVMAAAQKYLGGDFYDCQLKNGEYMLLSLYE